MLIAKYGNTSKPEDVYTERHHIVPKCKGGTDHADNLTYLSGRVHFIAHWMLWRIHRDHKLALAFKRMCESPSKIRREDLTKSKRYEYAKNALSISMKGKGVVDIRGDRNPMKNKETKKKISESQKIQWKNTDIARSRNKHKNNKYEITTPEGSTIIISGLKTWCLDNHINYSSMLYSAKSNSSSKRLKGYNCKVINETL